MAVQRRNTKQRKLVLNAVRQSYNHPTATKSTTPCANRMTRSAAARSTATSISWPTPARSSPLRRRAAAASIARSSRMRISSAPRAAASSTYRSPSMPSSTPRRPSKSAGTSRHTTPSSRVSAPTAGRCLGHALKSAFPHFAAKSRFLGMPQMSTQQVDDAALLRPYAHNGHGH